MHEIERQIIYTTHNTIICMWKPCKGKNHGGKPYPQSNDTTIDSMCVQMGSTHAERPTT